MALSAELLLLCIGVCILFPCLTESHQDSGRKEQKSALDVNPGSPVTGYQDIVFVVISQPNSYHAQRAHMFKEHLLKQVTKNEKAPILYLTHEKWSGMGAWTVFPILPELVEEHGALKWVFICEEETNVNLPRLLRKIGSLDHTKELFLGKGLHDQDATIIHHFAFFNDPGSFAYPDFAAGFLLSMAYVKSLSARLENAMPRDFSIDPKHELAMFIWNEGNGIPLTVDPGFCTVGGDDDCFTTYHSIFPSCGDSIKEEDLFIAVKTCEKFHHDRVPVVQKTWGKESRHISFYSEKSDPSIPTVSLGIPNTERGHCGKMVAILQRAYEEKDIAKTPWLAITDDDTILSVKRLRKLLACYNPEEAIALGERYGYAVPAGYGYDYITGGGGMILSRKTVETLVDSGICECGSDDAPDDMMLGMWLKRLGIPVTHSPLFHQARPADYSADYLFRQKPVSFHKHWNVDPYQVYNDWFSEQYQHDEL